MPKLDFDDALDALLTRDGRYERDAYLFLRDALDFTVKETHRTKSAAADSGGGGGNSRHVTGQELLDGVRRYALEQFGPMVPTVLAEWRVASTEDVGRMVFNLIDANIFGRTEHDSLDDFRGGYDFYDAFVRPYLPPHRRRVEQTPDPGIAEPPSPAGPAEGSRAAAPPAVSQKAA